MNGLIIFGLLVLLMATGMPISIALGLDTTGMTAGPTTPDLEWQTWIIYSAIPLGSSLMCFRFLQVAWNFHRTGDLPHHDHGHVEGLDEVTPHDVEPAKT